MAFYFSFQRYCLIGLILIVLTPNFAQARNLGWCARLLGSIFQTSNVYKFDFYGVQVRIDDGQLNTPLPTLEVEAKAAANAWQTSGMRQRKIKIQNVADLRRSSSPATLGIYHLASDSIVLALDTIRACTDDFETELILVAAHEVAHMIQVARGDRLLATTQESYLTDPHEIEANQLSLDVLKYMRPKSEVVLDNGRVRITMPNKSILNFVIDEPDSLVAKLQILKGATDDAKRLLRQNSWPF